MKFEMKEYVEKNLTEKPTHKRGIKISVVVATSLLLSGR